MKDIPGSSAFHESGPSPRGAPVRTKIVATLGPASSGKAGIQSLIEGGVDVFRLNMAHGSIHEHAETLKTIRHVSDEVGRPVGVLVDLAGPKIRLGEIASGSVECVEGSDVFFIRGPATDRPHHFVTTYPTLVDELAVGDSIMLADGTISLVV